MAQPGALQKPLRTRPLIVSLVLFAKAAILAPALFAASLTALTFEADREARNVPVTFGLPFPPQGVCKGIEARESGRLLPLQLNPKRHYPSGALKHAIVSLILPEVLPGRPCRIEFQPRPAHKLPGPPVEKIPKEFSASLRFCFPDGSTAVADAKSFLERAQKDKHYRLTWWLRGPFVSELWVAGPPQRHTGTADPDLLVLFGLRIFKDLQAVRVEAVVENPWVDTPGNIPYDVSFTVGGKEVFSHRQVGTWHGRMPYWLKGKDRKLGHFAYARWRHVAWWGAKVPSVHIRFPLTYLAHTGLLPPYATDVRIASERIARMLQRWRLSRRGILENGIIMGYFPTTGGREDLGPYPAWTTIYLMTGSKSVWPVVLGTGTCAGSFPVHLRDRKTGSFLSLDDHPGFSLNRRGTFERIPPRNAGGRPYVLPAASPYQVDAAHQPSLAFVPYLLTGERYYLEEMTFWANWCMLKQNAAYRLKGRGLLLPDQVRGEAWALRQLVDVAKIAPDRSPERAYFHAKVRSNLRAYNEFVKGPHATPLGTYTIGASDAYVRGRPPAERYKYLTLAPWQQNFLVWSLDHAVRAGYREAARPRDYFAKLQIGLLTHPDDYDPRYAAPYFLVVGEREGTQVQYYRTWKELFEKTFRVVAPSVKPGLRGLTYGSSYPYIGRAVLILACRANLEGAQRALTTLQAALPDSAAVLARDPTWAFSLGRSP